MSIAEHLYAHPGAAGVANILLSLRNRTKVAWNVTACAKKVDLKGQRAVPWQRLQNVAQGRVRDQATIPVGLAIDLNRREARGQGTARHHVLRPNNLASTVEIDKVSRAYVHRANAEPGIASLDTIEVNEPLQCGFEKGRIIIAGRCSPGGPAAQDVGAEETRLAEHQRRCRRRIPHYLPPHVVRKFEPIRRGR